MALLSELVKNCKTHTAKKVFNNLAKEWMSEASENITELEQEIEAQDCPISVVK